MNRVFITIVLIFAVIGSLLVYQASQQGTSVVYLPSELVQKAGNQQTLSRVRVAGRVAPMQVDYQVEPKIELRFFVHDPKTSSGPAVPVIYHGLKPDMFSTGRDVIIDGNFQAGILHASKLLTQCPSKYQAPDPANPKQGNPAKEYK